RRPACGGRGRRRSSGRRAGRSGGLRALWAGPRRAGRGAAEQRAFGAWAHTVTRRPSPGTFTAAQAAGRYSGVMLRPGQVVGPRALLCLGVVMVNSAGMSVDPVEFVPVGAPPPVPADQTAHSLPIAMTHLLTGKPSLYMGLAILAMAVASVLPLRRLADVGRA